MWMIIIGLIVVGVLLAMFNSGVFKLIEEETIDVAKPLIKNQPKAPDGLVDLCHASTDQIVKAHGHPKSKNDLDKIWTWEIEGADYITKFNTFSSEGKVESFTILASNGYVREKVCEY